MFSLMWGLWEYLTTRAEVRVLVVGLERAGKTSLLERIKAACAEGAADGAGGLSGLGAGGLGGPGGLGGAAASSPSSSAAATPSASSSSSSSASSSSAPAPVPPLPSPPPTIGMNLARVRTAGVTLVLWDVGGSMRGIWDQYYAQADCVLFVVDASERARFGEAASTLELVLQRSAELGGGGGGGGGGGSDAGAAHGAPRTALPVVVLANKQDRLGAARAAEVLELVCRPAGQLQAGGASGGGGVGGSSGASGGGAGAGADLRRESRIFETSAQTLAGVRDAVDFTVGAAKAFAAARA